MANVRPDGFVELNRTFSDFHEDIDPEQIDFNSSFASFVVGGTPWEKLLRSRCVVILAEAGSGKTWELKSQAQVLRGVKRFAFFIALESLAQNSLDKCLTQDDKTIFRSWLKGSSEDAVFFLDAVDEAKLATRYAFEKALQSFSEGIDPRARNRVKVVVSSRITGWRSREDRQNLLNLLDLPKDARTESERGNIKDIDDTGEESENVAALRVVTLDLLTHQQIQKLADDKIPEHSSEFLEALDESDAWSFARRPQDVIRLARYWNVSGGLGSLTELLEFDIHSRLQELEPDRQRDSELADRQLRCGAEALAAAAVLGKTLPISLEADVPDPLTAFSILPSRELPGWTSKQRGDLLNRALFDPAAFGLVRFHHRSATDYLAACWLDNLLASELSIHETLSLFFARSLGEEVLIPSRAAVVCWLACRDNIWNRRIREKLIAIAPDALLSHGDVGQLDVATRKALLLGLASRAAQEEYTYFSS